MRTGSNTTISKILPQAPPAYETCRMNKMLPSMLISAFFVTALASPLSQRSYDTITTTATTGKIADWTPAAGTKTICDTSAGLLLSSNIEPQLENIINNACAAMMPKCAFPDRVEAGTMCIQTIDWPLDGPKTSSFTATLNSGYGNKTSGYKVQCE